jgi:superfamily II DNA/RNA helicase
MNSFKHLAQRSNATLAQRSNATKFADIGIKGKLLSALEKQYHIVHPTISQKAFIPAILSGGDLFIRDLTGSGKTFGLSLAAVAYPTFMADSNQSSLHIHDQHIKGNTDMHQRQTIYDKKQDRYIHTLMMVPTRDLAIQVFDWIKGFTNSYIHADDVKSMVQCIISGPEIESQKELLKNCTPRIVVGTPNRLLELNNSKDLDFSRLRLLIVDEADRIVNCTSSHATVKKRFNAKVHKRDGELLLENLFKSGKKKGIISILIFSGKFKNSGGSLFCFDKLFS